MSIKVMKQALEALETEQALRHGYSYRGGVRTVSTADEAINALRTAIQQAEAQQPATTEPVAQWQKRHPVRTGGRWISTDEHDAKWWSERATGWEARALYTRPAPSGLGDSKRLDYLQDRGATIDLIAGVADFYPMQFRVGGLHSSANIDVRAAIDAAMLAAKEEPNV